MAKPGSWAKGQKPVTTVDLSNNTTAEGVAIVDADGVQITSFGGVGGGGAATIADGADVAQGTTTDLASANTVVGLLKNIKAALAAGLGRTWTLSSGTDSVAVSGTVTATGPLTDTQIRATPLPVSGTVTATTGGLTDTQLRATPVTISGTVTASGPLTDTQLRATPVPVSGTVTATVASTTISSGTVAATQSGTWTVTDATIAADAATSEPSVGLIGGWDGLAVRAATMTVLDGENMMSVRDPISRRLLEEILLELRVLNENVASSLSTQRKYDGPLIAGLEFK